MIAIFKREFKSYFTSPLGYVVFALFALYVGNDFHTLFSLNQGNMPALFSSLLFIIVFVCPILTMRLMSEDKRLKVDQALLTAPVSLWGIVLGKFLAAFAIFALCMSLTFVQQLVFSIYVTPDWLIYIGNLLGILLMGAALLALGLFISAMTESQMVSAIISFGGSLFIILLDDIIAQIDNVSVQEFVSKYISFNARYQNFASGVLDFSDLLFFLSFAFIFLFLAERTLEKKRWS